MAAAQAKNAIPRWEPWWHLPEAAALRLTAHGTLPVQLLAERDTPRHPNATQGSPPEGDAVPSDAGMEAGAEPCSNADVHASSTNGDQQCAMPPPPDAPLMPLRVAEGRPPSSLVR